MTRDEFIFELIDQCMYIACLDNIMVENFELRDDTQFYIQIEKQFYSCIKFYEEMSDLYCRDVINISKMNEELQAVLALMHQKVLKRLFEDFDMYLSATRLSDEEKERSRHKLKSRLATKTVDTEFLLNEIQNLRRLEQESSG